MKINALIKKLQSIADKNGNIEVLVTQRDDEVVEIESVKKRVCEDGEFPDEYGMPKGFVWVDLWCG